MKKNPGILFILLLILIGCEEKTGTDHSIVGTITDDLDEKIVIEEVPERVISLGPNLTEMIYELSVDEFLVGNTKYCYYPPAAKEITKVGDMLTFDYEKILQLKPDLIFITVEGNRKNAYDKLLKLGLKVFVSNPRDYKGIKKTFSDMGKIFNEKERADSIIAKWNNTYDSITVNSKKLQPQKVMVMIELNPLMLAGKNTFINGYIEACNMKNFVEDSKQNYPLFSREVVLERKPDIIVYPSSGTETIDTILEVYPEWADLPAVIKNNVFFVDRDLYFRPGPRYVEALEDFYNRLTAK